jgi:hypothetical protein
MRNGIVVVVLAIAAVTFGMMMKSCGGTEAGQSPPATSAPQK